MISKILRIGLENRNPNSFHAYDKATLVGSNMCCWPF